MLGCGGETLQKLTRELYAEGIKGTPSRADFKLPEIWKDAYMNRILGIDSRIREKESLRSVHA